MLSDAERREIEAELAHYEHTQAACVEALKIVQRRRGWVSDEQIRDAAELLDMAPEQLEGVATFYNLIFRRPVGKHVILLCDSVSCWITGYDRICERLKQRLGTELGQTTDDGRFTLLPMACLGACERGPAMMIGDELFGDLDDRRIEEILRRFEEGPGGGERESDRVAS